MQQLRICPPRNAPPLRLQPSFVAASRLEVPNSLQLHLARLLRLSKMAGLHQASLPAQSCPRQLKGRPVNQNRIDKIWRPSIKNGRSGRRRNREYSALWLVAHGRVL